VGAGVGERDEVTARLRRRVREARVERRDLGPGALRDRPVHLVGRHVHDARHAHGQARVEQHLHASHVRGDKLGRAGDRPVHVRLGGEVHDGVVARQPSASNAASQMSPRMKVNFPSTGSRLARLPA
jgi:hypothetical protein